MIKLTATAPIHDISPVLQVSDNFQKRELILDDSWEKDGKTYTSLVLIEFSGSKMSLLDSFAVGQRVTVEAYVNGREYQGRYYTSLKGMGIVPYQQQQASPSSVGQRPASTAPVGYPQQPAYGAAPAAAYAPEYAQPAYPQQPVYPQQGGFPAGGYAQPSASMPGSPQGCNLGPEGLPFPNG